jgi:hypothetical protein
MRLKPSRAIGRSHTRASLGRPPRLTLLGPFDLTIGAECVLLPLNGQRVLAFLALQGNALLRSFVAGSLWLDSTYDRAAGCLRSALWRVNRVHGLVDTRGKQLSLPSASAARRGDEDERMRTGAWVEVQG